MLECHTYSQRFLAMSEAPSHHNQPHAYIQSGLT